MTQRLDLPVNNALLVEEFEGADNLCGVETRPLCVKPAGRMMSKEMGTDGRRTTERQGEGIVNWDEDDED